MIDITCSIIRFRLGHKGRLLPVPVHNNLYFTTFLGHIEFHDYKVTKTHKLERLNGSKEEVHVNQELLA